MNLYQSLLRPALFRLEPEGAHRLALLALRSDIPWRWFRPGKPDHELRTTVAGLDLANPIGLAAGLDKTGLAIPGLAQLGFGYLVVGSFTPEPRAGNARPRLLRDPVRQTIVNSLGLPNPGFAAAARTLAKLPVDGPPVLASVAGFSSSDLVAGAIALEPHVRGIEIGLICPNTTAEEQSDELGKLETTTAQLAGRRHKPVFVKLPPFHDASQRAHVLRMVDICADAGLEGVSVSGTRRIREPRLATGEGSLAGRPVFEDTLRVVADVAERAHGRLAVKASGGAFSGENVAALLNAGASTAEIYSAFVFRGPWAARSIAAELIAAADRQPFGRHAGWEGQRADEETVPPSTL